MSEDSFLNERPNAWGRWGAEDEAGALNLIGPAQVKRAAGLVQTGQVVRLAQLLSDKTPVPRHRAGLQHFMGSDGGDYAASVYEYYCHACVAGADAGEPAGGAGRDGAGGDWKSTGCR